ncbi:MAG: hypothetical protein JXA46_11140 [Dehalococcoidales bacterium]|nr:hypothetical protein [Dehalococcoidales bacterium]
MHTMKLACISVILIIVALGAMACTPPSAEPEAESRGIAEEFVKNEATFQFDGILETLQVTSTDPEGEGWKFTIEFDSRHAGYGERSGQALAEVITHHTAEIAVRDSLVTEAIMDGQWNMIDQRIDVEIRPAPIDEVKVNILKSNPPQIGVYIKGGLPDGCTTFHGLEIAREESTINIKVTIQRPRGVECPAIYTTFEKDVNLGSDFIFGTTYTLNVNDYTTTFEGTLMEREGFTIYLTGEDIPPDKMEMQSHVNLAGQPVISIQDIIAYNARTHEISLTDEAFERIDGLSVPVRGKSFVVCVDRSPVYWGAFWTPVSSMSFDGVTIWKPLGTQETKTIAITLGYPGSSFYGGDDPRNDPAVLQSLEQAGKLVNGPSVASVEELPRSFKGYELYSWAEDSQWYFTLITGTNRSKTAQEIVSGEDSISENGWVKIHAADVDSIINVLSRLPKGEFVFWCDELHIGDPEVDFQLPPEDIVDQIRQQADQSGLDFTISAQSPPQQFKQTGLP